MNWWEKLGYDDVIFVTFDGEQERETLELFKKMTLNINDKDYRVGAIETFVTPKIKDPVTLLLKQV